MRIMVAAKQLIEVTNDNGFYEEYMTMEEIIHEQKQFFINNYMTHTEKIDLTREQAKDNYGKLFIMKFIPANKEAAKTINSIWKTKKQHFRNNYDDFISAAIVGMYHAIRVFNPKSETFDWLKLNELGSKENIEAHRYASTTMAREVEKYATFLAGKQRTKIGGKLTFRKLDGMYETSMDQEYIGADGEAMTLHDITKEDANILFTRDDSAYTPEHFLQWFLDSIGELEMNEDGEIKRDKNDKPIVKTKGILSSTLLEFYTIVKRFSRVPNPDADPKIPNSKYLEIWSDSEHPYEHLKTKYSENQRNYAFSKIAEVMEKAYKKEFPNGEPRLRNEKSIAEGIELFEGFVECVDKSEVEYLNENVSDWIRTNWHETKVAWMIQDSFTDAEQYDINGSIMNASVVIAGELIERIIKLGQKKLDEYKNWDQTPRKYIKLLSAKEILVYEKKATAKMVKQNEKQGYMNLTTNVYGIEVDHDFEAHGEAEYVAGLFDS